MLYYLVGFINAAAQVVQLLVLVDVILSYFMSPYHPVRDFLDRLVNPMLNPIRRVVPLIGGFDISPVILIILVQLIASLLVSLISMLLR